MDQALRLCIKNEKPVELLDLTRQLTSLSDEYRRHLIDLGIAPDDGQIKLFVKEVRSGSIEIDLVDLASYAIPAVIAATGDFNTVVDFARNLKSCFDFLVGSSSEKPKALTEKPRLKNLHNILEPVAKDHGSQMTISPIINAPVENLFVNVVSMSANASQNEVTRLVDAINEPVSGRKDQVALHWYQARNDVAASTGDRAIIESISTRPVKTTFENELAKQELLNIKENLFKKAFIVDVQVETVNGRPVLYKIIKILDQIDL